MLSSEFQPEKPVRAPKLNNCHSLVNYHTLWHLRSPKISCAHILAKSTKIITAPYLSFIFHLLRPLMFWHFKPGARFKAPATLAHRKTLSFQIFIIFFESSSWLNIYTAPLCQSNPTHFLKHWELKIRPRWFTFSGTMRCEQSACVFTVSMTGSADDGRRSNFKATSMLPGSGAELCWSLRHPVSQLNSLEGYLWQSPGSVIPPSAPFHDC